jgi:hypothetical protein
VRAGKSLGNSGVPADIAEQNRTAHHDQTEIARLSTPASKTPVRVTDSPPVLRSEKLSAVKWHYVALFRGD